MSRRAVRILFLVSITCTACGPSQLPAFANPPPEDAAVDDLDAGPADASR